MPQPMLERARANTARARAALDAALLSGANTEAARAQLRDAIQREGEILAAMTEAERPSPEDEASLMAEAKALVTHAESAMLERLAAFAPERPGVQGVVAVEQAAALLRARAADRAQRERIAEHDTKAAKLRDRIAEVTGRRAEILARRAAGEQMDSDAATVALAAADLEGLQAMLAEHEAQRPADPAAEMAAKVAWDAAQRDGEMRALLAYAGRLQAATLAAGESLAKRATGTQQRLKVDQRLGSVLQRGLY